MYVIFSHPLSDGQYVPENEQMQCLSRLLSVVEVEEPVSQGIRSRLICEVHTKIIK